MMETCMRKTGCSLTLERQIPVGKPSPACYYDRLGVPIGDLHLRRQYSKVDETGRDSHRKSRESRGRERGRRGGADVQCCENKWGNQTVRYQEEANTTRSLGVSDNHRDDQQHAHMLRCRLPGQPP